MNNKKFTASPIGILVSLTFAYLAFAYPTIFPTGTTIYKPVEGWKINHKRVYRLYREEGLSMRQKPPRRRRACLKRKLRPVAYEKNECWSMDFMSDQLFDGHRIRLLTLVDNHTREQGKRISSAFLCGGFCFFMDIRMQGE